jgi:hypothetical protein
MYCISDGIQREKLRNMKKEQKKMRKTMRHIPGTVASDEVEG